jgi:hypothetical protein
MTKTTAALAFAVLFFGGAVSAQQSNNQSIAPIVPIGPPKPDVIAKTGVSTKVANLWDCEIPRPLPLAARADNGKINIVFVREPACGRKDFPQSVVMYESAPDFKGIDTVYIMGFRSNGRLESRLQVKVE